MRTVTDTSIKPMRRETRPWTCPRCAKLMKEGGMGPHLRHCGVDKSIAFWAKVDKSGGPDACWPWTGAITSKHGYGCVRWQGRVLGAHKVAWELTNGPVPKGKCVLHECDNRPCCNPAHHFIGTKTDNMQDMYVKGRSGCTGEKNVHAKLTIEAVRAIRSEYRKEGRHKWSPSNAAELAARYGVRNGTITNIIYGRAWKHVT